MPLLNEYIEWVFCFLSSFLGPEFSCMLNYWEQYAFVCPVKSTAWYKCNHYDNLFLVIFKCLGYFALCLCLPCLIHWRKHEKILRLLEQHILTTNHPGITWQHNQQMLKSQFVKYNSNQIYYLVNIFSILYLLNYMCLFTK